MFKRLFISLLILSTLTAEGVAGIPQAFWSCLNAGSAFSLTDKGPLLPEYLGDAENSQVNRELFVDPCSYKEFKISFNKLQQLGFNGIPCDSACSGNDIDSNFTSDQSFYIYTARPSRKVIIEKSDSSPPTADV